MQTTDLNPLAQWLCHERKKHGGVRQHLADKLGINSTTLREYEIGRYAPPPSRTFRTSSVPRLKT